MIKVTKQNAYNQFKKNCHQFGIDESMIKLDALRILAKGSLPKGKKLVEYMDLLLFIKAYPENDFIYYKADAELKRITSFLAKNKVSKVKEYVNSGLPFAPIHTKFSHDVCRDLLNDKKVTIELDSYDNATADLNEILKQTLPPSEREITTAGLSNADLLEYLLVSKKNELRFVIQQLAQFDHQPLTKDYLFSLLGISVKVTPKKKDFSRALNAWPVEQHFFTNFLLKRFDHELLLNTAIPKPLQLSENQRSKLVQIIKRSLLLLARETDPVTYMQEDTLSFIELERGISIALYGITPDRQLSYESYVGYTLFKNGLPMAYGGGWVFGKRMLFGINIFELYRGGESGYVLCQLLRTYKQLFSIDHIEVEPYQYGLDNPEGIASGAFWFYYKYGFRPLDPTLKKLAESEFKKIKTVKGYRSSEKVLLKFTESNIALNKGTEIPITVFELSQEITAMIAKRFKGNRQRAIDVCTQEFLDALRKFNSNIVFETTEQKALEEVALWMSVNKSIDLGIAYEMVKLKTRGFMEYQELVMSDK